MWWLYSKASTASLHWRADAFATKKWCFVLDPLLLKLLRMMVHGMVCATDPKSTEKHFKPADASNPFETRMINA